MQAGANDPMAELTAMRSRGEINAEEFTLAKKYLRAETAKREAPIKPLWKTVPQLAFWLSLLLFAIFIFGGVIVQVVFGLGSQSTSTTRISFEEPRSGFATTQQEILACETSDDIGRVGFLWKEGQREEADYHARRYCIMIPKYRRVLLIQGGFKAGLFGQQELEVEYLGQTRRLFTTAGDGLFAKS